MFLFDVEHLRGIARSERAGYQEAEPFPHVVLDDFLPGSVIEGVLSEFPSPSSATWHQWDDPDELKLESKAIWNLGPKTRALLNEFNSSTFVTFLQELTGIEELLISDPFFEGGGLHQIEPGGHLKVHADFNKHSGYGLDRRINALLYLNQGWEDAWGGHLELWNRDMTECIRRVAPNSNRLVVFNTTDEAYHGHPDPLLCPKGNTRKSVALYYYSNGRPSSEASGSHTTIFRKRPGETRDVRASIRQFIPPVAVQAVRRLKRALRESSSG